MTRRESWRRPPGLAGLGTACTFTACKQTSRVPPVFIFAGCWNKERANKSSGSCFRNVTVNGLQDVH